MISDMYLSNIVSDYTKKVIQVNQPEKEFLNLGIRSYRYMQYDFNVWYAADTVEEQGLGNFKFLIDEGFIMHQFSIGSSSCSTTLLITPWLNALRRNPKR